MTANLWIGLLLTLIAGVLSGNCMLPMKFAKRWPWEGIWLVFSIVSLAILPWSLAIARVKDLHAVYAALPATRGSQNTPCQFYIERQYAYGQRFRLNGVYTPQLVIHEVEQVVGSCLSSKPEEEQVGGSCLSSKPIDRQKLRH
ncbi:MAG TPA: L-rhamnose/proton symporter RhaT [Terracidiphilus sp.]|jgi:hypothetical protein